MKREPARNFINRELTVRDLLLFDDDIDVYDDVCTELGEAFVNPCDDGAIHEWDEYLTEEGMKKFGEVLDYPMHINPYEWGCDIPCAIIHIDDEEGVWQKKLRKAKRFFEACAGYCTCDEYERWFKI